MQHRNSLPPHTNPAKAANATKTDSRHLPQKCMQSSKQFTKKKTKPISQKHKHTHTHTSERIPGWLRESNPATGICTKNMQERRGMCILGHGNRVSRTFGQQ